jgi:chromosome segregation ATPase
MANNQEFLIITAAAAAEGAELSALALYGKYYDSEKKSLREDAGTLYGFAAICHAYPDNRKQVDAAAAELNEKGKAQGRKPVLGDYVARCWASFETARALQVTIVTRTETGDFQVTPKTQLEQACKKALQEKQEKQAEEDKRAALASAEQDDADMLAELLAIDPQAHADLLKKREEAKALKIQQDAKDAKDAEEARLAAQNAADEVTRIKQERDNLREQLNAMQAERVQMVAKMNEYANRIAAQTETLTAYESVLTASQLKKLAAK